MNTLVHYHLQTRPRISTCALRTPACTTMHVQDKAAHSWERFNESALPQYMKDGVRTMHDRLDKLADLSQPHKVEDDKNLWFMVDALIQARHLLDDTRVPVSRSDSR